MTTKGRHIFARRILSSAAAAILLATAVACVAQDSVAATSPARKAWTFEVVSVRPSPAAGGGAQQFGPTADGYRMRNLFLLMPILTAYVPQTGAAQYTEDQLMAFPDWVVNAPYDIDAKVSQADLTDWQNPAMQPAMLRSMLQAMLADRLKLVVHHGTKEAGVYLLLLDKGGPKFKQTKPGETHPGGMEVPGGGVIVAEMADGETVTHYYGFSMEMIAPFLSPGRSVQDKTGLTGKYDFVLRHPLPARSEAGEPQSPPDSVPSIFSVVREQLGLKLVPAKGQVDTLVLDHAERPSAN